MLKQLLGHLVGAVGHQWVTWTVTSISQCFPLWSSGSPIFSKLYVRESTISQSITYHSYIKDLAETGVIGVFGDPAFSFNGLRGHLSPRVRCPRRPTPFCWSVAR